MVRKTREQVFRELDVLGEDEVRRRLDAKPAESRGMKRAVGSAALIGVAAVALAFLLARRRR